MFFFWEEVCRPRASDVPSVYERCFGDGTDLRLVDKWVVLQIRSTI